MRNQFQESRIEPEPLSLREPRSEMMDPIPHRLQSVSARFTRRLQRFDKLYASAALYACLSFGLAAASFLVAQTVGGFLSSLLSREAQLATFLTIQLGTFFLTAILVGLILGKRFRSLAPQTGKRGIALGGALIFASFAWTFLRPLYLEWIYREVSAISKIITIVDTLIYLTPHITAFLAFGANSENRK